MKMAVPIGSSADDPVEGGCCFSLAIELLVFNKRGVHVGQNGEVQWRWSGY